MKRILCAALSLLLVLSALITAHPVLASADSTPSVSAEAAILYEPKTRAILYSKNADTKLPMASTTKIMTALTVVERAGDLSEVITVADEAVGTEGSSIYLKKGDRLSILDLLYSLLLQSANDAAVALAVHIGGDIAGFAELMNQRAAELGAESTHFTNPHGLDDSEHYTTARDLAIISAAALENELLSKIFSTYKYSFFIGESPRTVVNHNKLLKSYKYAKGVKTGYTKKSGRCLVSAAERDGLSLIAVTLNAPDDWRDHKGLLDFGFDRLTAYSPEALSETELELPVLDGTRDSVTVRADLGSIHLILPKDCIPPRATVNVRPYLVAPVGEGDEVGEIIYYSGDTELCRAKIYAQETVKRVKRRLFDFF